MGGRAGTAQIPLTTFAETERDLIARALQSNRGNKVHAAKQLQISRKKLYAKIAKYGLFAEPQQGREKLAARALMAVINSWRLTP